MQLATYRILLVDDNPGDAELASEWLAQAPSCAFDIVHVATLGAALSYLEDGVTDAVILDLNLPDSRGLNTLTRVKAVSAQAPVIVVSGLVDKAMRRTAWVAGADDVFSKDEVNSRLFSRSVLFVIERNRAREQHRRLEHLLDTTPDAILVTNLDGEAIYVNRAALTLFGRPLEEFTSDLLGFSVRDGEPVEISIARRGDPRLCEMRVAQMEWGGKPAHLATIRDITEQRQAERLSARSAELELQNQRMQEASRLKSEFLANMSHEIRTPMNAIIGLSYLLNQTPLDTTQSGLLGKIQIASRSLLGLINDVLDLSKIEAGQLTLEHRNFDLDEMVREVVQLVSAQAEAKHLELLIQPVPPELRMLKGDATRVRQIITNLMSNAVKFTEQGTVELVMDGKPCEGKNVLLRCVVRDTGIGIAPEVQQRLFTDFSQADTSTTRRFGGTGLGLSIVRRMTELMGGKVGLRSQPGQGSEFCVTLVLGAGTRAGDEDETKSRLAPRVMRVLLHELGEVREGALRAALRTLGWQVQRLGAESTLEPDLCERLFSANPPDVVLVDAHPEDNSALDALIKAGREFGYRRLPPAVIVGLPPGADAGGAVVLTGKVSTATVFAAVDEAVRRHGLPLVHFGPCTDIIASGACWLQDARLLVVDDSDVNRDVACGILARQGASVRACSGGEQALALLQTEGTVFDAVLMDVQMPGIDGNVATRRLRRVPGLASLPVIALTAGALTTERQRAFEAGMDDFISKPLDPSALIRMVRQHVERSRGTPLPFRRLTASASGPQPTWPHIDGIDSHDVSRRLGHDVALFISMIDRVLREYTEVIPVEADDAGWAALPARMHRLRGSAGMLGASAVQQLAADAERLARRQVRGAALTEVLQRLDASLVNLRVHAQPLLDAQVVVCPPAVDLERGGTDRLVQLLAEQNLGALAEFKSLTGNLRQDLGAERFEQLRVAMRDLDFRSAASVLDGGVPA